MRDMGGKNDKIEDDIDFFEEKSHDAKPQNAHTNDTMNIKNEGAGLYNLGNTCYMNSLLQCLKNVFPLTQIIFSINFDYGSLILEYKQLLCNMISSKNDITDALDYYNALGRIDSYYACHEQRDSSKLFLTHIKALIEDTKNYPSNTDIDLTVKEEEPKLVKRYNKSKERNPSFLYDYFYGFLKTVNECYYCKHNEVIYQPYSLISLNLTTDKGEPIKDLYGLIKNYEGKKQSLIQCTCGSYFIEQTIFGRIPPILVFKFERSVNGYHFDYQINYDSELYMKKYSDGFLDKKDNKKNPNLKFNLVGVMLHTGNAYGGHKTSYTKNFINKNWYFFNDEKKYIVNDEKEVLNAKEAFMLFYISESFQISPSKIQSIINKAEENSKKCNYHKGNYYYHYNYPKQNSYYNDNKLNQNNEIYNREIYNINGSKYNDNKTNSINDIYNNNINYNLNNVAQMTKINSKVESNNITSYCNINGNQGNAFNNTSKIDENNIINNNNPNLTNEIHYKVALNNIQYNNNITGYQVDNKATLNNFVNYKEDDLNKKKEYFNKVININNNVNNGNNNKNQVMGKNNSNKGIPKSNNTNKKDGNKAKTSKYKYKNANVNKHKHH